MKQTLELFSRKTKLMLFVRFAIILIPVIILQSSFSNHTANGIPNDFKLYENSLNAQSIKFDIPLVSNMKITVFDKNGGIVKGYLYDNIQPGIYELNISDLDIGNYTYTMSAGEYLQSFAMSVSK